MDARDVVDRQSAEIGERAPLHTNRCQRLVVQDAVRRGQERTKHAVGAALDNPGRELWVAVPVRVRRIVDSEGANKLDRHRGGLIDRRRDERQLVAHGQVQLRRDGIEHHCLERARRIRRRRPRALGQVSVIR